MSELPPVPRPKPHQRVELPPIPRPKPQTEQEIRKIGLEAAEKIVGIVEEHTTSEDAPKSNYEAMSEDYLRRKREELFEERTRLNAEKRKVEYTERATHNSEKIEKDRARNWEISERLKVISADIRAINKVLEQP